MAVDLLNQIVLRWDSESDCAALLEPGGVDAVWFQKANERIAASCRAAGAEILAGDAIRLIPPERAGREPPGKLAAIKAGVWPGAHASARGPDGAFSAGASQRAWVDANGYRVAWLKALYPAQPPVLAYLPDRDAGVGQDQAIAYDSLELALVDAWTAGGNYILSPDAAYRDALLRGDSAAAAAWSQMGRTARWLKEHRPLFRQKPLSTITALVEPGETTAEIAALLFRQSASPELVSSRRIPPPDPSRRPVVVAAGVCPSPELGKLLLAHAWAGATVVTDAAGEDPWWRIPGLKPARRFEDRAFYMLGAGRILAYSEAVVDPGDFALDILDLAGARRPVRLWDCPAGLAMVSQGGPRAKPVLQVVNYGSPARADVMVHVQGVFSSASLLRPGERPAALRTYRRGNNTEVMLPALRRLAVVVFG